MTNLRYWLCNASRKGVLSTLCNNIENAKSKMAKNRQKTWLTFHQMNQNWAEWICGEYDWRRGGAKTLTPIRNSSGQSALGNFLDCNNDYARNEDCVIFYYVWFKYANNWYCRRRKYAKSSLSEVNNNILPDVPTKQDTNEEDVWFFTFSSRRWRLTHRWNHFS